MISFAGHQIIRWSSANRHRLFKRTDADLGKHVLEVHPGHSQSHVKQVLHDMHSGDRDSISIMIKHHGQPVNIAFYALRNDQNKYLGCVEVTQDVSKQQTKGSFWRNIIKTLVNSKQRDPSGETLCKSYIKNKHMYKERGNDGLLFHCFLFFIIVLHLQDITTLLNCFSYCNKV